MFFFFRIHKKRYNQGLFIRSDLAFFLNSPVCRLNVGSTFGGPLGVRLSTVVEVQIRCRERWMTQSQHEQLFMLETLSGNLTISASQAEAQAEAA